MKDVIIRNMERLLQTDAEGEREPLEPMTEWKWRRLYKTVRDYHLGPWIAEGIKAYGDDFFLQLSPTLHQEFMDLQGEKDDERLDRFLLEMERSRGLLHRMSKRSLQTYASDLINTIKNVEE